jgi:hypothetical protein
MTSRLSATETGTPLDLIPHAIARQIHRQGGKVNCISVKRALRHHYNITVGTKLPKRELRPGRARYSPSRHEPADNSDSVGRDADSGDMT